jgi:peptidoglycan/LPS O-acetylase OafA/YrhL
MDRPNLSTKGGRKAWLRGRRMVAARPRRIGLALLAAAMLLAILPLAGVHSLGGWSPRFLALCVVVVAAPFLIAAAWLRRRYLRSLTHEGGSHRIP